MSVQAMGWVIEHSQAGGGDLLVLLMIANHAKSDGTGAWPSVPTLAKESRMSERNVRYCLRDLELSGELIIETGAGPRRTNLYTLKYVAAANLAGGQSATVEGEKVAPSTLKPVAPEPSLEPSKNHPSENGRKDELFETIVTVCAWDLQHLTRDARGRANSAAKELREVGARPSLVLGFGELWKRHYPRATLTPQAITGNWPDYMAGKLFEGAR